MRRVCNLKVFVGLLVVILLGGVAIHVVHKLQVGRSGRANYDEAMRREAKGELLEALKFLKMYVMYDPDDLDAMTKYGDLIGKLAQEPVERRASMLIYEKVLAMDPTRETLRRKVVSMALEIGLPSEAIGHLDILIKEYANEAGLEVSLGQCYESLGKFDEAADHFEQALQKDPHLIDGYERLLRLTERHPSKARDIAKLLDRFVEANPGSATALLERGRRKRATDPDEAGNDLSRARELAPNDADVLLASAGLEQLLKKTKAAKATLDRGVSLHPKDPRFYLDLAHLELKAMKPEAAVNCLKKGLEATGSAVEIQWMLANLDLDVGRLKEAEGLIDDLRARKVPANVVAFLNGRLEMSRGHWSEAVKIFTTFSEGPTTPKVAPEVALQSALYEGRCHEQTGDNSHAETAFRRAWKLDPQSTPARLGLATALAKLGRWDESLAVYRELVTEVPVVKLSMARIMVEKNLNQPPERRYWKEIEALLKEIATTDPDSIDLALTRAAMLVGQDRLSLANEVYSNLKDRHPDRVDFWLLLTDLRLREGKPAEALSLLDAAREKLGDRVELRVARAYHGAKFGSLDDAETLKSLEADASKYSDIDQTRLFRAISAAYQRLGSRRDAARLWTRLAELEPDDLDVQFSLYQTSLQSGDETAAAAAANALSAIRRVDGPDGPVAMVSSALPLLTTARTGDSSRIAETRSLLQNTIARKPGWPTPILMLAELGEITGDREEALRYNLAAIEAGVRDPLVIRKTIGMLFAGRRFDDADRLLRSLGDRASLPGEIRRMAYFLSLRNDSLNDAIASARASVAKGSKEPGDYLWLAQLLTASKQSDEAEPLLRRAIKLDASRPEPWLTLTAYLTRAGRADDARKAVEEARPNLLAANQVIALASCYEVIEKFDQVEDLYRLALKDAPRNAEVLRLYTEYSLRQGKSTEADGLLKTLVAMEDTAPREASWARRTVLIRQCQGADDDQLKRLLDQFREESQKGPERQDDRMSDRQAIGLVLANQPLRPHRKEAITLLQGGVDGGYSSADDDLLLAQLCEEQGDFKRAQELVDRLLLHQKDHPRYLECRALLLIRSGQRVLARSDAQRLKTLAPQDLTTVEIEARLFSAEGRHAEAVSILENALKDQPPALRSRGAALLEELGSEPALRAAETILRKATEADSDHAARLKLALFLGRRGKHEEAFGLWRKACSDGPPEALASAGVFLGYTDQSTDAERDAVATWLESTIRDQPKSAILLAQFGLLREKQNRFDDAAALYRRALELNPRQVTALNNLAWLLSTQAGKGDESLALIDRAIAVSGPIPPLLDTRAMALLSLGKNDPAIKDLETAVEVNPTSNRLLHLARAQLVNGDRVASLRSYELALKVGLKSETLHPLERGGLDAFIAQIHETSK